MFASWVNRSLLPAVGAAREVGLGMDFDDAYVKYELVFECGRGWKRD